MKKLLIFIFLIIAFAGYSQRDAIFTGKFHGLDTNNILSNYLMTKYRASVLYAPIVSPTFTGTTIVEMESDTTALRIKTYYNRFTIRPQIIIADSLDEELMRISGTGENSVYIGKYSGGFNDTIYDSVLIGSSYYHYNARNVGIGGYNFIENQWGYNCVGIGWEALMYNRGDTAWQAEANTAVGAGTMKYNENGIQCTGVGMTALHWGVDLDNQTGVGYQVLAFDTLGGNNTGIGAEAFRNIKTSTGSFAGGSSAGRYVDGGGVLTHADSSVYVGLNTRAAADSVVNETVIGPMAIGNGSNTATIGDDKVTDVYMNEDGDATAHMGAIKLTAGDTTGIGSTANVPMIMYFNGHFYGLIGGTPPTWEKLNN